MKCWKIFVSGHLPGHIGLENPIPNEKYLMYRSALRFSVIRTKNSKKYVCWYVCWHVCWGIVFGATLSLLLAFGLVWNLDDERAFRGQSCGAPASARRRLHEHRSRSGSEVKGRRCSIRKRPPVATWLSPHLKSERRQPSPESPHDIDAIMKEALLNSPAPCLLTPPNVLTTTT